jgi:hypothetical protein
VAGRSLVVEEVGMYLGVEGGRESDIVVEGSRVVQERDKGEEDSLVEDILVVERLAERDSGGTEIPVERIAVAVDRLVLEAVD